ncbi:hypothetical protein [Stieleria sp.]|uniref:hypothetical protein n=1 Tax=Stieleria sp. TaxID=2795976 RepID=UPI003565C96A
MGPLMMRFAFLFFALIAGPVFGQITHTETVEHVIRGVSAADLDGDCLVLPDTTAPKVERTTLIVLDGAEGYSILVLAKEPNGKPVRVTESERGGYRAYTTAEAWVTLFCTDFANQKQQLVDIVINEDVEPEPEPDDPDPPTPAPDNVPEDDFGNIGQRVAKWSAGVANRIDYAIAYEAAATRLRSSPSDTVDDVGEKLVADLQAVASFEKYLPAVGVKLNEDIKGRWPLSRGVLADYYTAIAVGFRGGVK